jgi:hypothetical protein
VDIGVVRAAYFLREYTKETIEVHCIWTGKHFESQRVHSGSIFIISSIEALLIISKKVIHIC